VNDAVLALVTMCVPQQQWDHSGQILLSDASVQIRTNCRSHTSWYSTRSHGNKSSKNPRD